MADAFEVGVNMRKAIGDIENMEADLKVLKGRIQHVVDEAVRMTADDFRDEVQDQIRASEIESDTGELMNSWKVRPKGVARYQVRSTADHAVFLELGTRNEYPIQGNPLLYFEPEPGTVNEYPDRVVTDDEMILIEEVTHPGVDEYGYFSDAYEAKNWHDVLQDRLEIGVGRLLREFQSGGR